MQGLVFRGGIFSQQWRITYKEHGKSREATLWFRVSVGISVMMENQTGMSIVNDLETGLVWVSRNYLE